MDKIINHLWEAAGKDKDEVNAGNIFRGIGFDADASRLGWVNIPSWDRVKEVLNECLEAIDGKNEFIFVGMGGSINGVKTIATLNKKAHIYCLDSLDPAALGNILIKIKSLEKTMVISISKSGTTKETQLISQTLRRIFGKKARGHFLWLTDVNSYNKLDASGWSRFNRIPIQIDKRNDIGGRFSSPHTLIFLLPLFIILNKNFKRMKAIYSEYSGLKEKLAQSALLKAREIRKGKNAYFSIALKELFSDGFRTWITQLFQESIGSKKDGLSVKTLVTKGYSRQSVFRPVSLKFESDNIFVKIMSEMYYLQNFIAFYAYYKKINFVNQPCVEEYKTTMRGIDYKTIETPDTVSPITLAKKIKGKIKPNHRFIEVIFYFYPLGNLTLKIESILKKNFPRRLPLVFVGSDWNHHSYQAASCSKDTLYVLVTKTQYISLSPIVNKTQLKLNTDTLRVISYATYLTIKDKALLLSLKS